MEYKRAKWQLTTTVKQFGCPSRTSLIKLYGTEIRDVNSDPNGFKEDAKRNYHDKCPSVSTTLHTKLL